MNDKPILFSGPMVRALLEGRKTQTRRIVKPANGLQSEWASVEGLSKCPTNYLCTVDGKLGAQFQHPLAGTRQSYGDVSKDSPYGWFKCPYGQTSGAIWVRETCQIYGFWTPNGRTKAGKPSIKFHTHYDKKVKYDGDFEKEGAKNPLDGWHTKPSIHMPRWACRITLEIKDIRVERLRDITLSDIRKEGVEISEMWLFGADKEGRDEVGRIAFSTLWESINGTESWDANPWVWVVSFDVHPINIDDFIAAKEAA